MATEVPKKTKRQETNVDEAFDLTKKKKKAVKVDPKVMSKILKQAEQLFNVGSKKNKLKRPPQKIRGKKIVLKPDLSDNTEEVLDLLKEKLIEQKLQEKKQEAKQEKKKSSSYWLDDAENEKKAEDDKYAPKHEGLDKSELGPENWVKSERDYVYVELLERMFSMLRKKNPQLASRSNRIIMKPPQVMRDGAKKTNFANFAEICQNLNRTQDHVSAFLFAELGTNGSVDQNGCLIIKGRYNAKSVESLLKKYMGEYVICHMCGSLHTILVRNPESRLQTLQCSSCGASRTVSALKRGFLVNTIPRKRRQP